MSRISVWFVTVLLERCAMGLVRSYLTGSVRSACCISFIWSSTHVVSSSCSTQKRWLPCCYHLFCCCLHILVIRPVYWRTASVMCVDVLYTYFKLSSYQFLFIRSAPCSNNCFPVISWICLGGKYIGLFRSTLPPSLNREAILGKD